MSRRSALAVPFVALLFAAVPPAEAANPRPQTIPALRDWKGGEGTYRLRPNVRIVITRRRLRREARLFAANLRSRTGRRVRIVRRKRVKSRRGDIRLLLGARDERLGREGYRLKVGRTVVLRARRRAGVFYGTRTLLQLLRRSPAIPRGRALDWPRYPERGLMVDVGRKYFTPGWIRSQVRELAYLKLNYLHLHLSDNQGFRIQSETHPEIVSKRHLTKRELRGIIALARRYHVSVVPEIDMPGHMQAALEPHPELRLRNAFGAPRADALDVTSPAARRFARDLVEEYLPLFPGRYWHTGADEVIPFTAYPLYPALASWARARYGPEATGKDAIHDFVNWVNSIVRRHGKTTRMWHDDMRGGVVTRDPNIVVEWWTDISPLSDARPLKPQQLLDRGHRIMNAGWFPTYYVNGPLGALRPDMKTAYEAWEVNEFYGPLVYDETLQNPPEQVAPGEPRNLGSKINVWNDDPEAATETEIAAGIAPRLRVMAQKTWNSPPLFTEYDDFERLGDALAHSRSSHRGPLSIGAEIRDPRR